MQLDAWKLSDDLALEAFRVGRQLPADLRWLSLQLMRSATSVPANIAEGYHRASLREYLQFLSIARGSLAEVEYYLHFLGRADLIDAATERRLSDLTNRSGQTLSGLMGALRAKLPARSKSAPSLREPPPDYLIDGATTGDPRPGTRDPRPEQPSP